MRRSNQESLFKTSLMNHYDVDPHRYLSSPIDYDVNPNEKVQLAKDHNLGDCYFPKSNDYGFM